MSRLAGQTAVVIGASRGIGKAIALALASEGATVGVVARREGAGQFPGTVDQTVDEIRAAGGQAEGFFCDIADSADVNALIARARDRLGRIDMLVNSAVHILYDKLLDITDEGWARAFQVNVTGAFYLTRAVAPVMIAQGGGRIVHLTGAGAREVDMGITGQGGGRIEHVEGSGARRVGVVSVVTGASKAALERFVRGAAYELRDHRVAVNLFCPGPVKTERFVVLRGSDHDWSRYADPGDVAPAAVHLALQPAETMTGEIYSYQDHLEDVQ